MASVSAASSSSSSSTTLPLQSAFTQFLCTNFQKDVPHNAMLEKTCLLVQQFATHHLPTGTPETNEFADAALAVHWNLQSGGTHKALPSPTAQKIISTLIQFDMAIKSTKDAFDTLMKEKPATMTADGYKAYVTAHLNMGDMIYAYNFEYFSHWAFDGITSYIQSLRAQNPLIGHQKTIVLLASSFKGLPQEDGRRRALAFYKTWWFLRPGARTTVYSRAIEWHIVNHLVDNNAWSMKPTAFQKQIKDEMEMLYTGYTFDDFYASSCYKYMMILKRRSDSPASKQKGFNIMAGATLPFTTATMVHPPLPQKSYAVGNANDLPFATIGGPLRTVLINHALATTASHSTAPATGPTQIHATVSGISYPAKLDTKIPEGNRFTP